MDNLEGPVINQTLSFSSKILVSDKGDLVVIGRVLKPIEASETEDLGQFSTLEERRRALEQKKKEEKEKLLRDMDVNITTFEPQDQEKWQSEIYDTYDCKVRAVIFACEDVPQEDTLRKMKVELIGPYLVYKREFSEKIDIINIETGESQEPIHLKNMIVDEEENKKFVNFFRVPKTAFQSIKSRRTERDRVYYKNLLQVIILNQTFIYDLDDETGQREINFVHDME